MRLSGMFASLIVCVLACPVFAADHDLATLTKQLDSGSNAEKTTAARKLGELGPAAASAVPSLVKSLESDNAGLRYETIIALGMINSSSKQVVPALARTLADPMPLLRLSVIDSLRKFGPEAQPAIPQLKTLMDDKELILSVSAARAIMEIEAGKGDNVAAAQAVLLSQPPKVLRLQV